MTTQTEALKIALEALDEAEALLSQMGLTHLLVYGNVDKSITAIKESLANHMPDATKMVAQQSNEQVEPVAWIEKRFYDDGTPSPCFELKWAGRNAENDFQVGTKFYTVSTQQSTIVRNPLTDEVIHSMCKHDWMFETIKQWVRIIEKAHGIGENK